MCLEHRPGDDDGAGRRAGPGARGLSVHTVRTAWAAGRSPLRPWCAPCPQPHNASGLGGEAAPRGFPDTQHRRRGPPHPPQPRPAQLNLLGAPTGSAAHDPQEGQEAGPPQACPRDAGPSAPGLPPGPRAVPAAGPFRSPVKTQPRTRLPTGSASSSPGDSLPGHRRCRLRRGHRTRSPRPEPAALGRPERKPSCPQRSAGRALTLGPDLLIFGLPPTCRSRGARRAPH